MTFPPQSFAEASRVERGPGGQWMARIPAHWEQGAGAYGGIVVALAIRAMEAALDGGPPLRALSAEIPSPVLTAQPTEVRVEILRRGRSLSSVEARLVQAGEVRARASGLFGAERPVESRWEPEPPAALRGGGRWEDALPTSSEILSAPFLRHFEMRHTVGAPFAGQGDPTVEGWVRPAVPLPSWGAAEVAAMVDCYYPAFFPRLSTPRPAATIAYGLHTTPALEALDPTRPLYYRAHCPQVSVGYAFELRELWTAEGALVALNPQTFAIIK